MYKVFIYDHLVILCDKQPGTEQLFEVLKSKDINRIEKFGASKSEKPHVPTWVETQLDPESFFVEKLGLKLVIAAGGVVQSQAGRLLAIFRKGKWDLPKGKIEKGESIESCALREVEEEVNLKKLKLNAYFDCTYHVYKDKDGWCLKKSHWFLMEGDESERLIPQLAEDITQVQWFNRDDLTVSFLSLMYASLTDLVDKWKNQLADNQ